MAIGGKNTTWETGSNSSPSSLVSRTTSTKDISLTLNGEKVDVTACGNNFRAYEASFRNGTMNVKFNYTDALALEFATQWKEGTEIDFQLAPDGEGTGKLLVTGSYIMENFNIPISVGAAEDIDVSLSITGEVDFALDS